MIPIFVINLEFSKDRRASMERQLGSYGLPIRWIKGVDGNQQKRLRYDRLYPKARGCTLSHLKIYRIMRSENIQQALVLEDDAHIGEDFYWLVKEDALRNLQFDVVQIGSMPTREIQANRVEQQTVNKHYQICKFLGVGWHTTCYAIRNHYAQELLRHPYRHKIPIDYLMFHHKYNLRIPHLLHRTPSQYFYSSRLIERRVPHYKFSVDTGTPVSAVPVHGKHAPSVKKPPKTPEPPRRYTTYPVIMSAIKNNAFRNRNWLLKPWYRAYFWVLTGLPWQDRRKQIYPNRGRSHLLKMLAAYLLLVDWRRLPSIITRSK